MEIYINFFETRNSAVNRIEKDLRTMRVLKIPEPLCILKGNSEKKIIIEAIAFKMF